MKEWRQKYQNNPAYHPNHPEEIKFRKLKRKLLERQEELGGKIIKYESALKTIK